MTFHAAMTYIINYTSKENYESNRKKIQGSYSRSVVTNSRGIWGEYDLIRCDKRNGNRVNISEIDEGHNFSTILGCIRFET